MIGRRMMLARAKMWDWGDKRVSGMWRRKGVAAGLGNLIGKLPVDGGFCVV